MFPCHPPFSYSGVGEIVVDRPPDFVPQRFLQRTVTIINEHTFTVPGISSEKRAEPELVWSVKPFERAHTLQKKHCKLAIFLSGFDEVAPLRGQNIDSRAAALLVLLSHLNGKI